MLFRSGGGCRFGRAQKHGEKSGGGGRNQAFTPYDANVGSSDVSCPAACLYGFWQSVKRKLVNGTKVIGGRKKAKWAGNNLMRAGMEEK